MIIGGADIASTSGLCVCAGETFTASSFRPRAKRPFDLGKGELDYSHEGQLAREFRDHLRAWLVVNEIEAFAVEQPLRSNVSFKKPIINTSTAWAGQSITYEERGGTTMNVVFRLYMLVGQAAELCARLNIPLHVVNQSTWRKAFYGDLRPPKGTSDASKWWKEQAKRQCSYLKVDVANADAAESVGIAFWLRGHLTPRLAARPQDLFREKVPA